MAAQGISLGAGVVKSIASLLLAGHTARLQGATNENQAAQQVVSAYDADLQQIAQAVSSGAATPAQGLAAVAKVDQQIYAYLKSQVGKPGTAWNPSPYPPGGPAWTGSSPQAPNGSWGAQCNKSCTAGCCMYYDDFHPGIVSMTQALQAGGGTATIPTIYASKYGVQARSGYTIAVTVPAQPPAPAATVAAVISAKSQGAPPITAVNSSGSPIAAPAANTNVLLFGLLLVGGGIGAFLALKR